MYVSPVVCVNGLRACIALATVNWAMHSISARLSKKLAAFGAPWGLPQGCCLEEEAASSQSQAAGNIP